VAERLPGWGVRILAYDPFVNIAMSGVTLTDLPALFASSDVVTLHAAPSHENRRLINGPALARMKPTAILINTGRGSLIDYAELRSVLASGLIAGAALDVYEYEPPDSADPLFSIPNVICTPRIAAWTWGAVQKVGWHGACYLWRMISVGGEADIINPEARRSRRLDQNESAMAPRMTSLVRI
jgi:D-3-phosphoglycerate dehydrogenase / 2-oxoglutarate reductase